MEAFIFTGKPARVIFGPGTLAQLATEGAPAGP